jgi:4-amino-4-deoxy-L-arabinose transferase-like glycosyltransferase
VNGSAQNGLGQPEQGRVRFSQVESQVSPLLCHLAAHAMQMRQNAGMENAVDAPGDGEIPKEGQSGEREHLPPINPALVKLDRSDRNLAIWLFLVTLAYLWIFRRYTSVEPDEGIVLEGAQRILRGEVLYRDFFSFFTPGSYYLLALLFRIFGNSFLVGRLALVFVGGIYSMVTYLLARRVCARGSALFAAGIVTLTTLPYRFEVLHNWDSTLWSCLAVYAAVRWLESPHWKWAFATGSFASLTFLFEQSKGGGLILGLGVGLTAITMLDLPLKLWSRIQILALAAGLAWPFALTLAYFGAQHSNSVMLGDWFWPLRHYSLVNHVPYGYQNWSEKIRHLLFRTGSLAVRAVTILVISPLFLIPLLPLFSTGLLAYWVVRTWRRNAPPPVCAYYILMCSVLFGLLISVVIGRADIIHFMYLQPLLALVLAWMVEGRDIPGRAFIVVRPYFVTYLIFGFLLFSAPLLLRATGAPYRIKTHRGLIRTPENDTVLKYVQAHVAPGGTILVYPYLPLYYYLTDTYSATRYAYFQPGMHTPEQAQEMLSEIEAKRVSVVLFEPSFWEKIPNSWPSTPLVAIAQDPIADYIQREYRSCQKLKSAADWQFLFMVRKDLPCP